MGIILKARYGRDFIECMDCDEKRLLLILMVVFLPITSAFSVKVSDLYAAKVPVISQSYDVKEQAVNDGFLQVLIKITGNTQVDKNPTIRANLKRANYYVHDYGYLDETPDSSHYLLQIVYEPKDVNRLLKNAKIAYWGDNRPLVLVWLVAADVHRTPDIVSSESSSVVYKDLNEASDKYGLPLIFPVMDMDELSHISTENVTHASMTVLNNAAKRYSPDAMLIGEVIENELGVQSKWQLIMNDFQWSWSVEDKTMENVVSSLMSQLNNVVMKQFAMQNKKVTNI